MSPAWPLTSPQQVFASRVIRPAPGSLSVSTRQVARYAGGSRYRPDDKRENLLREVIATAERVVRPALVYAVHPVSGEGEPGTLRVDNRLTVHCSGDGGDLKPVSLAAVVCTLGPGLEEACFRLSREEKVLEALFLDAAATALLEALAERARQLVETRVRDRGLFPSCRFAPGYGAMPLSEQARLFALVDAGLIGVQLSRHLVMTPGKSLSFFATLTEGKSGPRTTYKCRACSFKDCRFRLPPEDLANAGFPALP